MSTLMENGHAHIPVLLIGSVVALSALLCLFGSAGAGSQQNARSSIVTSVAEGASQFAPKAYAHDFQTVMTAAADNAVDKQVGAGASQTARKPGWVVGTITDARGQPIKGAWFEVEAYGTTLKSGENVNFRLDVDDNGRFEQELPDGSYAVTAFVVKEFEGATYHLRLHPADNKHKFVKLPSKAGIVKDFTWKLTGLQPDTDRESPNSYYGSEVRVRSQSHKLADKFPKGSKAVLTLTPRGALIDGSKAEPLIITGALEQIDAGGGRGHVQFDVPIGAYKAEAKIVTPDGKVQLVKVSTDYETEGGASVDAQFKPRDKGAEPLELFLGQ